MFSSLTDSIDLDRIGRAIRYAFGRTTEEDAQQIIYECQPVSGWFPLETLSVESVIELAEDCYGEHPAIPHLAAQACRRVWNKWCGSGDVADAAQDWAMDLLASYAKEDGIDLQHRNEDIKWEALNA